MQRADSLEKTLMLGKTEGRRRRRRQKMRWLDGITDSVEMGLDGGGGDGSRGGGGHAAADSDGGISSVQFSSVTQSCLTLCDPVDYSTPSFRVLHQLLEFA